MANNPIQIVLNAQNYVQRSDINPGGANKDFYAGRNEDFVRHREAITAQLKETQIYSPKLPTKPGGCALMC